MNNIFIIHGTGGSPQRHWFPWIKSELEKLDTQLIVLENAGHINEESGYSEFEFLLEKLKVYCSNFKLWGKLLKRKFELVN